jgi:hypothetical protein
MASTAAAERNSAAAPVFDYVTGAVFRQRNGTRIVGADL